MNMAKHRRFEILASENGTITWVKAGSNLWKKYKGWGWQTLIKVRKPFDMRTPVCDQAKLWALREYSI